MRRIASEPMQQCRLLQKHAIIQPRFSYAANVDIANLKNSRKIVNFASSTSHFGQEVACQRLWARHSLLRPPLLLRLFLILQLDVEQWCSIGLEGRWRVNMALKTMTEATMHLDYLLCSQRLNMLSMSDDGFRDTHWCSAGEVGVSYCSLAICRWALFSFLISNWGLASAVC